MIAASGVRRLQSWIQSFCEWTEPTYTPLLFRKWAAISTIAGAIERKIWTRTRGSDLYPNLYILLVSKPGIGKGLTIERVNQLWRKLEGYHVAPASMTNASFMDALDDAKRKIVRPTEVPPYVEFNSLLAAVQEFSDFVPTYDPALMSKLQSVYDGYETSEKRRGKQIDIKIPSPYFNFLAGTTPGFLNLFMVPGAWDQGFASRTILIYSHESSQIDIFAEKDFGVDLFKELSHDLSVIGSLYGKLSWSKEAAATIQRWNDEGRTPLPNHRRLEHYNTRRLAHVIKLSIIASIERGKSFVIEQEDFLRALDWLLEAESYMPGIFQAMSSGGDSAIIDEAYQMALQRSANGTKAVVEHHFYKFLKDRMPVYAIQKTIETMVKANMLRVVEYKGAGLTTYLPVVRTDQTLQ